MALALTAFAPQSVVAAPAFWNRGGPAAVEQTPHPAVARIIVPEKGATSYGSGTLIDARDQYGLVVTNWHVVREASDKIEVVFPNGFRSFARALKVDQNWDLAALVIWRPDIPPVPIAPAPPRPGDVLTIAGYGQGSYRAATGNCTQYLAPAVNFPQELVEVSVQARQGDSGGPILNQRGELAGVLFGASHGTTMGSYAGRVRGFLASVAPELGQDAPQIAARDAAPRGSITHVTAAPHSQQVAQQPPPATTNIAQAPPSSAQETEQWSQPLAPVPRSERSEWSPPMDVADNPPARLPNIETPAAFDPMLRDSPAVTALTAPATNDAGAPGDESTTQVVTWRDLAGYTFWDQAKTALALVGSLTLVYWFLRLFGG